MLDMKAAVQSLMVPVRRLLNRKDYHVNFEGRNSSQEMDLGVGNQLVIVHTKEHSVHKGIYMTGAYT